jgi:hypothetical protein
MGYFEPAMSAVLDMDVAKVRQVTGKIRKASRKMGKLGPRYNDAKDECRDAA